MHAAPLLLLEYFIMAAEMNAEQKLRNTASFTPSVATPGTRLPLGTPEICTLGDFLER